MADRETAVQRRTRIGIMLAHYDALTRELAKLKSDVEALKADITATVPIGIYGEWHRGEGTPRRILDQPAARKLLTERNIEVPTVMTKPSLTVTRCSST